MRKLLILEEGPADVGARRIPSSCAPRFGKFQPNLPPNLWGHRFNGGNFFNFHPPHTRGGGFWVTNEGAGGAPHGDGFGDGGEWLWRLERRPASPVSKPVSSRGHLCGSS